MSVNEGLQARHDVALMHRAALAVCPGVLGGGTAGMSLSRSSPFINYIGICRSKAIVKQLVITLKLLPFKIARHASTIRLAGKFHDHKTV